MAENFNDFMQAFHHVDRDGDGKISPSELQVFMKSVGIDFSSEEIGELVEFDENKLIGYEEFAKLVEVGGEEKKMTELREAFGMFEVEGEGRITAESLKAMLGRMGAPKDIEECKAMICRFDLDGDGELSFEEFKVMML